MNECSEARQQFPTLCFYNETLYLQKAVSGSEGEPVAQERKGGQRDGPGGIAGEDGGQELPAGFGEQHNDADEQEGREHIPEHIGGEDGHGVLGHVAAGIDDPEGQRDIDGHGGEDGGQGLRIIAEDGDEDDDGNRNDDGRDTAPVDGHGMGSPLRG